MTNHPSDDFFLNAHAIGAELATERARQDAKFGEQNHDFPRYYQILNEELGEMSRAHLEGDNKNLRTEMVQAAAVLVAMIECGDRNGWFQGEVEKFIEQAERRAATNRRQIPCDKGTADRRDYDRRGAKIITMTVPADHIFEEIVEDNEPRKRVLDRRSGYIRRRDKVTTRECSIGGPNSRRGAYDRRKGAERRKP